jgi:hypothetical protein
MCSGLKSHIQEMSGKPKRIQKLVTIHTDVFPLYRYEIKDLYPDTSHMVEIRAHNNLGFSPVSALVIRTAKGKRKSFLLCMPRSSVVG